MSHYRLYTLGELRLTGPEGSVLMGRRKELALLAYLASRPQRSATRDELTALLWEQRDDVRARQSFRQALMKLKRVFGDGLESTGDMVRLASNVVELDATAFEADVASGRLSEAAERWRGDFLAGTEDTGGESFRVWLETERENLRRRLSWVLEKSVEQARANGDPDAADSWTERWTTMFPFDEAACRRRIDFLRSSGRFPEAVAVYAAFVARLRNELELEPSADFLRLAGELEKSARGPTATAAGSAALIMPDLIGRSGALNELLAAWAEVRAGGAAIALVEGEEGIGKTRLCDEFVRRLDEQDAPRVLLHTRAHESELGAKWATLRRLLPPLRTAPGLAGAPDGALAELSELVPSLRERFPRLPDASRKDGAVEPAVLRVLRDVAAEVPVLVLVDDFVAADEASRQLLLSLMRTLPCGVLVVVGARPEELEASRLNRELGKLPGLRRIKLQRLSVVQVEHLVASMLELSPPTRHELAARLHAESEGNPFYVIELVSALADNQLVTPDASGTWQIDTQFTQHPLPLPSTLRDAARERLQLLPDDARRVINTAAALGRNVESSLLEAVAGLEPHKVSASLDVLVSRRLLREANGGGHGYEFTHELFRRAAYDLLPSTERQAIHRAAAAVLHKRPAGNGHEREALHHHRERAGTESRKRRSPVRWVALAAMFAGLLATATFVTSWRRGTPLIAAATTPRLVVVPFENQTGNASLDVVGRIAADWLTQGIAKGNFVKVLPPALGQNLTDIDSSAATGLSIAQSHAVRAGADLVVWGSYYQSGDSIRMQARISDVQAGELLYISEAVGAPVDQPMAGIETLRQKTLAGLASRLDPRLAATAAVQSAPPTYEAYRTFAEGLDYIYRRQGTLALHHLMRAYAMDTTFTLPLLYAMMTHHGEGRTATVDSLASVLMPRRAELAPYDRAVLDLHAALVGGELAGIYNAARAAADIAPQSIIAANHLPFAAIALNRPAHALDYLERIDIERGEASRLPVYWAALSAALHMLGKYDRQIEVGEEVRLRFPDDSRSYYYEVRALAGQGRFARLDEVLREAQRIPINTEWGSHALSLYRLAGDELMAHGHTDQARKVYNQGVRAYERAPAALQGIKKHQFDMADLFYKVGRLDEARRIFEHLLANGPVMGARPLDIRARIGIVAALQGDRSSAAAIDRWLSDPGLPYLKGTNTDYRAQIAAALGDNAAAVRLLRQATAEGTGFGLHRHTVYASLRGYGPYDELIKPKN